MGLAMSSVYVLGSVGCGLRRNHSAETVPTLQAVAPHSSGVGVLCLGYLVFKSSEGSLLTAYIYPKPYNAITPDPKPNTV